MGFLSQEDIQDLETNLCSEENIAKRGIVIQKTKNCCEITVHTIIAFFIFLLNLVNSFFYIIVGLLLQSREYCSRIQR